MATPQQYQPQLQSYSVPIGVDVRPPSILQRIGSILNPNKYAWEQLGKQLDALVTSNELNAFLQSSVAADIGYRNVLAKQANSTRPNPKEVGDAFCVALAARIDLKEGIARARRHGFHVYPI